MADEPRRSGRATKGVNTKNEEPDPPPPLPVPKGKGKGKKKAAAAKEAEPEPEPEPEEEEDVIRCVCGDVEEIPGLDTSPAMIACDQCNVWQHYVCMGIEDGKDPAKYWCEQCKPQNHKDIIESIKKGEKIWEDRILEAIEAKNSKKKRGRKSKGGRPSAASASEEAGRQASAEAADVPGKKSEEPASMQPPPTPATETVRDTRRKSSAPIEEQGIKRRQSSVKLGDESVAKRRKSSVAVDSGDLSADRQKFASALHNHFGPLVSEAVKSGSLKLEDGTDESAYATSLSTSIEQALADQSSSAAEKSDKLRMIVFNTKKNDSLLTNILTGELKPEVLVAMSSEEMATDELQQERAAMKEEADKQAIILHEEGPRIRKTHKGDELVSLDGHDTTGPEALRIPDRPSADELASAMSPTTPGVGMTPTSGTPVAGVQRSESHVNGSEGDRKSSANFDINSVWKNVKSPDISQSPFPPKGLRTVSHSKPKPTASHGPGEDADIDRLLDDEMEWVEGAYAADDQVQWAGTIYMKKVPSVLKSLGSAKFFGGADVNSTHLWKRLLRHRLEISGRIPMGKADEYAIAHKKSHRKVVSVLKFTPSANHSPEAVEDIAQYFLQGQRWGVINGDRDRAVQDLYFVPVRGADSKPKLFDEIDGIDFSPDTNATQYFLVSIVATSPSPPAGDHTPIVAPVGTPHIPATAEVSKTPAAQTDGQQTIGAQPTNGNSHPGYNPSQMAIDVLGPFINEPVARQMVSMPTVTQQHLINLRDAFERDPRCRTDLSYLMQWLKAREAQNATQQKPSQSGTDTTMSG